jgi:hypothetical protein
VAAQPHRVDRGCRVHFGRQNRRIFTRGGSGFILAEKLRGSDHQVVEARSRFRKVDEQLEVKDIVVGEGASRSRPAATSSRIVASGHVCTSRCSSKAPSRMCVSVRWKSLRPTRCSRCSVEPPHGIGRCPRSSASQAAATPAAHRGGAERQPARGGHGQRRDVLILVTCIVAPAMTTRVAPCLPRPGTPGI